MDQIPRLSAIEMIILKLLLDHPQAYGLQLVKASGGKLKRGTIYVTLNRMREKGYVESRRESLSPNSGLPPRRLYWVTDHGLRVLQAWETVGASLVLGGAQA